MKQNFIVLCPDCRREISPYDNECIHCGTPVVPRARRTSFTEGIQEENRGRKWKAFWCILIAGSLLAIFCGLPEYVMSLQDDMREAGLLKMGYGVGVSLIASFCGATFIGDD